MKRALSFFCFAVFPALIVCATPAHALQQSGLDLYGNCLHVKTSVQKQEAIGGPEATACLNYIAGFAEGSATFSAAWNAPPFCLPTNIATEQLAVIYALWAEKNPKILVHPAAVCVLAALHEAFPCKAKE